MRDVKRAAAQAQGKKKGARSPRGRGYREHIVPRGPHHLYDECML
jgi:hypothetical protein